MIINKDTVQRVLVPMKKFTIASAYSLASWNHRDLQWASIHLKRVKISFS